MKGESLKNAENELKIFYIIDGIVLENFFMYGMMVITLHKFIFSCL